MDHRHRCFPARVTGRGTDHNGEPERALLIEAQMKVDHRIKVFQEHSGVAKWHNEWRVEYSDTEGGSYVTIFAGPQAEQRARDYHKADQGCARRDARSEPLSAGRR